MLVGDTLAPEDSESDKTNTKAAYDKFRQDDVVELEEHDGAQEADSPVRTVFQEHVAGKGV